MEPLGAMFHERLVGKVAFVTGAARQDSIGRATALRLAREGADVACIDIAKPPSHAPDHGVGTVEELDGVVAEIEALGRRALAIRADATDLGAMSDAVTSVVDTFGRLDICCAGVGGVGFGNGISPLVRLSEPEWDWIIDVNLKATWVTAKVCAAAMLELGHGGRIITVASAAALPGANGTSGMGAYAAAKAGVILLTQNLAFELGPHGINVNAVSPGMILTQASEPVRQRLRTKGRLDSFVEAIPLRRMAQPDEIASVVAFLSSDEASFVTGHAINATGGQTLG